MRLRQTTYAFSLCLGAGLTLGAANAADVTLNFANAGAIESDPATLEIARAFEAETGIKINIIPVPGPRMVEVNYGNLARGERTFDVQEALGPWLPDFVANSWVASLDDVIPEEVRARYSEDILKIATGDDGKLYAAPWYTQPSLAFYRSDLLQEAGLETPKTWDELLQVCQALSVDTDNDGNIDQFGFVYSAATGTGVGVVDTFVRFLYSAHGSLFDEDGEMAFAGEEGVAALEFMIALRNEHKCVPESVSEYQEGAIAEIFNAGRAASMWHEAGQTIGAAVEALGDKMTVAPLPTIDGAPAPAFALTVYPVVNANSAHLEEAKQFAAYLANYRSQWTSYLMESNVPTDPLVLESPYLGEKLPFASEIAEAVSHARLEARRGNAEFEDILTRELRTALVGEKSAKQALDDAIAAAKQRGI